ncbi:oligopeptide:H+ symporter [Nitrospirillum sp. BR 11164]|uniref:peptide MFS transporter n=1 Tax=Nitrospirillum sp. BR 11164 TaxID=3104324 RepID=UPI002AFFC16B|nr:oligopeptide:H+ symporter [Nitrospirillum sp. BR 11164]MEA1649996.1 oligopeptide:H+ symporter [Nitrospirillum sp. BR 11164]
MQAQVTARVRHPVGFWFVFWGELAERACYYGMRTLLALYITSQLGFSDSDAATVIQIFMASCYALPLIGGVIADRWLGRYPTIIFFSFPYIFGQVVLGFASSPWMLYASLAMLAMGAGAIKPNVSPMMARMYQEQGKEALMDKAFSYFYVAINIGGFVTSYALPWVRDKAGYQVALMLPAALMAVALVVFAAGKRFYPQENAADRAAARAKAGQPAAGMTPEERTRLVRMLLGFPMILVFWMAYDQTATTWVFFARDYIDLNLWPFGFDLTPDQLQAVNPLMIILLTPIFNAFWGWVDRRRGTLTPARIKVFVGFGITGLSIAIMALAGLLATKDHPVSIWFMLVSNIVLGFGELCISMIGLQWAYMEAPARLKSSITAVFYFTVFAGDMVGGLYVQLYDRLSPFAYFGGQVALLILAGAVFYGIALRRQRVLAVA